MVVCLTSVAQQSTVNSENTTVVEKKKPVEKDKDDAKKIVRYSDLKRGVLEMPKSQVLPVSTKPTTMEEGIKEDL